MLSVMCSNENGTVNQQDIQALKGVDIYEFFILFSQFKKRIEKREADLKANKVKTTKKK